MSTCITCGKLIPEPNVAYGIAPNALCVCCIHDRRAAPTNEPAAAQKASVAQRRASEATLAAQENEKHWVFAAAESHRYLVEAVNDGAGSHQREHLIEMLDQIKKGMSTTKACRWLGWIQACIFVSGAASLERLKEINKLAAREKEKK